MSDRRDWVTSAACRGRPVALWFPEQGQGAAAAAVCAACPVRWECLEEALDGREDHGVWGGAGEGMRRLLRRIARTEGRTRLRIEMQDYFDRLDEAAAEAAVSGRPLRMPQGAAKTFGPDARHGMAATYARGCRCGACREARMVSQRRAQARKAAASVAEGGDAA